MPCLIFASWLHSWSTFCLFVIWSWNAGKLSDSNLGEIVELLARHDFDDSCWQMLGLMLGLKNSVLQGIDANHGGGRPNAQTHALMNTLSKWISQDPQASWGKLITALEKCGHNTVAAKLRRVCLCMWTALHAFLLRVKMWLILSMMPLISSGYLFQMDHMIKVLPLHRTHVLMHRGIMIYLLTVVHHLGQWSSCTFFDLVIHMYAIYTCIFKPSKAVIVYVEPYC